MEVTCAICIDTENSQITLTSCRHTFHDDCLKEWMLSSNTCPICRELFPTCAPSPVTFSDLLRQEAVIIRPPSPDRFSIYNYRNFHEYYAQFRFGGHAMLDFTYPYEGAPIDLAVWRIRAIGSSWIPVPWIMLFSRRRGQTIEALEAIRRNNATVDLSTVGGAPPRRLYLCRQCRSAVFSSPSACARHTREAHPT